MVYALNGDRVVTTVSVTPFHATYCGMADARHGVRSVVHHRAYTTIVAADVS